MTKIMFVCHGNICRSPMAEFIMKDLVKKAGLEDEFVIASSAITTEEINNGVGNPVYAPAKAVLEEHDLDCTGKTAVQLTKQDYDEYDLIFIMDELDARTVRWIIPHDPDKKIHKILEYTKTGTDVEDPWYTNDFEQTYNQLLKACRKLLKSDTKKEAL